MAYDPRTGITTYGEADVAADPSMDLAAELAPSTATSFAPAPPSAEALAALQWAQSRANIYGWHPNPVYGENIDPEVGPPIIDQGPGDINSVLYGGLYGPGGQPQYNVGKNLAEQTLRQIAAYTGLPEDFDWTPYLARAAKQHYDQYGQYYDARTSNYAAPVSGAVQAALQDYPQLAEMAGETASGTPFWDQGESVRAQMRDALRTQDRRFNQNAALSIAAFMTGGPYLAGGGAGAAGGMTASELAMADIALGGVGGSTGAATLGGGATVAGGGMLDAALSGAARGAVQSAFTGRNPLVGAATGGISGGLGYYAAPVVKSAFDTFSPDIQYADALGETKQTAGMFGDLSASESVPADFFAPAADDQSGAYLRSAIGPTASQVPGMPVASALPGMLGSGYDRVTGVPYDVATGMATGSAVPAQFDGTLESLLGVAAPADAQPTPERQQPKVKEPSLLDTAGKALKIGNMLAQMNEGAPADAPQRAEGQSDADYAQALATYIQVDAQALADLGLAPGTPEYYEYLMSQLDATVTAMTQEIDVNAADLQQQLRGKTDAELTALRRALFVRGQLEQLMGSGTYTDPFTGRAEEVITNGRQVQPGVAAYHRGLGRTIGDFADLAPRDRQQAFGDFLGRDTDIYGMQARADARAEKVAQAQALFEDMKRRRGMFNQSQAFPEFSLGTTGDPELDAIFGLGYGEDPALRMMFGQ